MAKARFAPKPLKWALLVVLLGVGLWYALDAVLYAVVRERPSHDPWFRTLSSFIHLAVATPLLLLAPFQFSRRVRARTPIWHRRIGRTFLTCSLVAAAGAVYLGATFERVGSRIPLVLFGLLWFGFSTSAWVTARRGLFLAHERFVVRSYAIALAFVLVRLLGEFQDVLFPFMVDQALRDTSREWLSFVLPLLAVEIGYTWWPSLGGVRTRSRVQSANAPITASAAI
jgi:hypothetical protein